MRKKYLSALLFGALLFASAGTFTSCKDYDDDINNLQEQINTINTTLTELKGQIGTAGVSSVTFDEATGVLTVVDGKGTTTYKINTIAESMVEAEIKDGVLTINGEEIGSVVGEVTVENGKLMVDGKEVATLGGESGGSSVSLVKNEDNQTYTLTVDGTSVVLPANADAAAVPSVELENCGIVSNGVATYKVNWGVATSDITFGETKIATGELLLGGMTQVASVTVKPVTYDLSAQTLKLVDMDGKYAPVKVTAETDEAEATTGSRAVSNNGVWSISLSMLDTVTEENIETEFTKEVNGVAQNLKYALTVNGTRVTGYSFVVDTQTKNESETNEALTKDDLIGKKATIEAGNSTLSLADFVFTTEEAADVVMSSLTLSDVNAEAAGVTVDGMSVNVPASYSGQEITVKLAVLDVTGATSEREATIEVKASSSSSVEQIKQVEVSVSASGKFVIPFGEIFSKLDANVVKNIKGAKLTVADKNFFALDPTSWNVPTDGFYKVADNTEIVLYKGTEMKDDQVIAIDNADELRSVVCAKVTLQHSSGEYITGAEDIANIYGTFDLQLALTDGKNGAGNELKKIVVPVKVVAPTFDEYFTKNTNAAWVNGAIYKEVAKESKSTNDVVALKDADKLFTDIEAESAATVGTGIKNIRYDYAFKPVNGNEATFTDKEKPAATTINLYPTYKDGTTLETSDHPILKENFIKVSGKDARTGRYVLNNAKVSARATSIIAKVKLENKITSEIKVSEVFDLNFTTAYSNAKLAYYVNDVVADKAVVNNNNTIFAYKELTIKSGDEGKDDVKAHTGLALIIGDEDPIAVEHYTIDGLSNNDSNKWSDTENTSAIDSKYVVEVVGGSSIGKVTSSSGDGNAIVIKANDGSASLVNGQGGTLSLQMVDNLGIQTNLSIDYVKQDVAEPASLHR